MKNLYKFFLALICSTIFSQIPEVTRLPVQGNSQSIKESKTSLFMIVKTLINEFKRADRYEVTFNSAGLASGVYIYQLRVNDYITSKKMLLIK